MLIYAVTDSVEGNFWGPYTKESLAEKVLKIMKMCLDEDAELRSIETDEHAHKLEARTAPFKIEVEINLGTDKVRDTQTNLTWPPPEA
jgi:hypothetical protein